MSGRLEGIIIIIIIIIIIVSRDGVIGVVTCYALDGPGG
jgi:hypothetical protein